ncbi:MAG: VWA domain-containing protein, partial [Phenylobacterium sp.]|uniref:vWA domain-containing protein n=1 Tax=Phenylobacterium sp. TaxID=1871053 RepID=UPI0027371B78
MFMRFFTELREAKVPVTLKEYLMLMEALDKVVIERTVDEFYYLSRSALVKDEKNLDRFDQVFSHVFKGLEKVDGIGVSDIPAEWLKKLSDQFLTDEEKAQIEAMGGFEALMEELAKRMKDAKEGKGEGDEGKGGMGPKGDSPFGANGYHPEGVRVGQDKGRHGKAIKVWDKREYKNLDDSVELGTRNIKVALRRLRRWVREGAPEELDMNATIRGTAEKGYLDINLRAERRNKISVLIFFDIGGSMDSHIKVCEELFSAARSEFKNMEFYYFHNCLYESVWKDNRRRHAEKLNTYDILHKYPHDYKVIFVGDATMSPYEITNPGGSVQHWNEEAGAVWMDRVSNIFEHMIWL